MMISEDFDKDIGVGIDKKFFAHELRLIPRWKAIHSKGRAAALSFCLLAALFLVVVFRYHRSHVESP